MKEYAALSKDGQLAFEQMQCIALEIEKLLDAAMATSSSENPQDHFSLIEMAHD